MHRPTITFLFAVSLAAGVLLSGCAVNPVTGKKELSLVSEAEELAIGQQQYLPSQQSQGGRFTIDPDLSRYVNEVGQRVAGVSDRNLPWEFVVLNNGVPNAWALPGGKIAVNRGLLLELRNEAELAAVLGHEIVHAAARHGAKTMERGLLFQGAMLATAIGAADSKYENYIVGGAQLGMQLLSSRYSRQAELESDRYGIEYMAKAGYDPQAAVTLQQTFVGLSAERRQDWLSGLFASHPPSRERVERNRAIVEALKPGLRTDLEIGEKRYARHLAALRSRKGAYEKFDRALAVMEGGDSAAALSLVEEALAMEPREPRFYGLKADLLFRQKRYETAIENYDKALQLDPQYYEYYLGRGLTLSRLGRFNEARRDLESSNQLLPTAIAMNALGQLSLQHGDRLAAKQYFRRAMSAGGGIGEQARIAFTRLDLPENPSRYLQVTPFIDDGELVFRVINGAPLAIRRFELSFGLTIDGRRLVQTRRYPGLAPGQSVRVASGVLLQDDDIVGEVSVRVESVTL